MIDLTPQQLVAALREAGIRRAHLVSDPDSGEVTASHEVLAPLADFLQREGRDFQGHEAVFLQVSRRHDTLQGAFVHRTVRGQAAGGVRYWPYPTVEAYLRDGLRLATGMSHKNALAGLWWGGGKGVMARNPAVDRDDPDIRRTIYREYGEFLTALRGCYVTAADVGTSVTDMGEIATTTRFTTCIPAAIGGSGDPSLPTARGVIAGMETALAFSGAGSLAGRSVAVQGTGHVGAPLIEFLVDRGVSRITACDIDEGYVASALSRGRVRAEAAGSACEFDLRVVEPGDPWIFETPCDVFAPFATGGVLNPDSIARLAAGVVCGAANNQLEDPERDDRLLHERGIVYVPDFLVNRMGIVTCADESAGSVDPDPLIERHLSSDWPHSIPRRTVEVLQTARDTGRPPGGAATELAERLSLEPHPIFGHRGRAIIDSLVREPWFEAG
jgi:glutamate dehydrogenase/leucine dehydrogenase